MGEVAQLISQSAGCSPSKSRDAARAEGRGAEQVRLVRMSQEAVWGAGLTVFSRETLREGTSQDLLDQDRLDRGRCGG